MIHWRWRLCCEQKWRLVLLRRLHLVHLVGRRTVRRAICRRGEGDDNRVCARLVDRCGGVLKMAGYALVWWTGAAAVMIVASVVLALA